MDIDNQIFLGDNKAILQDMPDNSIGLVLTDPPYGISRKGACRKKQISYDFGNWDIASFDWLNLVLPKVQGWFVSFCAKEHIHTLYEHLAKSGFIGINTCVWEKPNPVPLNNETQFLNAWEAIVVGKKHGSPFNSHYKHNIFQCGVETGDARYHPTQKPIKLLSEIIYLLSNKGDIVLDPFMGSGSTCVAAINTGRKYCGIEIEAEYFEIAKARIEYATKQLTLF